MALIQTQSRRRKHSFSLNMWLFGALALIICGVFVFLGLNTVTVIPETVSQTYSYSDFKALAQ